MDIKPGEHFLRVTMRIQDRNDSVEGQFDLDHLTALIDSLIDAHAELQRRLERG